MSHQETNYHLKYRHYKEKYFHLLKKQSRGGRKQCFHPYSIKECRLRNQGNGCQSIDYNIEENQEACICSPDTYQCIKTNSQMGKKYLEMYKDNIEKMNAKITNN